MITHTMKRQLFAIAGLIALAIGSCTAPADATRNPKNCDPIAGRPHPSCKVP